MCDDAGPDTPPQSERDGRGRTGRKPASGTDAGRTETRGGSSSSAARGLMVEIGDVEAAVAFASVACKLLTHALRVGPHVATGFVSPSTARAVAHIVASPVANHALRRVALGCLKGVAVESGASVVPGETCLFSLASALFERSSLDLAAGPEREGYDGELAACVDAVLSAASAADVAAAAGACARGVVAIVAAGEDACESNLRASAFRLLELRRRRKGLRTLCSCCTTSVVSLSPSSPVPVPNHSSNCPASPKTSGSKKLRSAHSSCRLFWSGVPVIRRRLLHANVRITMDRREFSFLILCASSMMRYLQWNFLSAFFSLMTIS
mmetsp:Transcript_11425/g.53116  ORF Transcript_11425/g.53116 Transcript_11425/m.53116 type:complete len:324 (+) Transcript_11425:3091-4062(+)